MTKKIKVKNLINNHCFIATRERGNKPWAHKDYPWEALKNSLAKNGLLEPITISKDPTMDEGNNLLLKKANNIIHFTKNGFLQDTKYIILEGNHRVIALKELYGGEYEIDCHII